MKRILACLILVMAQLASAEVQQDIVFKSRFDLESSQSFINQLRIFLGNNNFGDPYSLQIKKPITIDLSKVIYEVPRSTQTWINELQSALKVKVFESSYRVVVNKFGYSINDFNSEFRPGNSNEKRVEYVTVNYVRGVHLTAENISFEIELKQTQTKEPIKFNVELVEPEFIVSPELLAELSMGWSTSILPENIHLTLESVDIKKIMERVTQDPDLIDLRVKDMIMPQVAVRIGHKEIKFDQKKIKNFFIKRQDELKKGLLDLLKVKISERYSNIIKDSPKTLKLPRTIGFQSEINGVFDMQSMAVNRTGIVQFDLDGHFYEDAVKPRRTIPNAQYQKSLREMNRSLIENKKNIAVSVSENYLNQLIEATIKAGLWEESLKGKDFVLGPEKSFILAEEKGELFSLYLDIIYKLKGAQRLLVGRSELRFPIKFMIGLKIQDVDDIPHLTIKVKKIATDHKLLLEGAPQYDLPTTVHNVPRFRNKVLKAIMEDVSSFDQETLIDIELSELKGTYLDKLELSSDGLGRGSATIGFKE